MYNAKPTSLIHVYGNILLLVVILFLGCWRWLSHPQYKKYKEILFFPKWILKLYKTHSRIESIHNICTIKVVQYLLIHTDLIFLYSKKATRTHTKLGFVLSKQYLHWLYKYSSYTYDICKICKSCCEQMW